MKKKIIQIFIFAFLATIFLSAPYLLFASESEGTIDSTSKYAWGEKIGWINFGCEGCNVKIKDEGLEGYIWSENYGWVNLNPTNGGVKNDGQGKLSGYAWGENLGWIDFSNVEINEMGEFTGFAFSEIAGKINFDCQNCKVKTDWRPKSVEAKIKVGGPSLPTIPAGGFRILIEDGAEYTESPIITLRLFGGPDTVAMVISNFPDLRDGRKEPYVTSKIWNLCQGRVFCFEGKYTLYAQFYTAWGTASEVVSDSIIYRKPLIKIPEIIKKIPEIFKPKPPEIKPPEVPIEELVPKEIPLVFKGKWRLLSYTLGDKPFVKFTLAPLPREFQKLAEKFPELGKTFAKTGIQQLIDIEKLRPVKLTLPGLTKTLGLPTLKIEPGILALPQGLPISQLSPEIKGKIPTEIVFAKTTDELIDFDIALSVTEKGKVEERITTISGKPLELIVRPDKPVKSVRGYLVFKSKKTTQLEIPLRSLLASIFFSPPTFAKEYDPKEIETRLVFLEFEYTDFDGDGIYTAEIKAPIVKGEYEIITVMDYEDPELGMKEIRLIMAVDPEGYVFERIKNQELRIGRAIVSLYWLNPETKQYQLWPAGEYQQENPQVTDLSGTYSFLVPEGYYFLKVEAPGYLPYQSKVFQIKEGSGIHYNIELKSQYWWLKVIDWKTILLVMVIILLLYNFYYERKREKLWRGELK